MIIFIYVCPTEASTMGISFVIISIAWEIRRIFMDYVCGDIETFDNLHICCPTEASTMGICFVIISITKEIRRIYKDDIYVWRH